MIIKILFGQKAPAQIQSTESEVNIITQQAVAQIESLYTNQIDAILYE
jgi:hypothetical protein